MTSRSRSQNGGRWVVAAAGAVFIVSSFLGAAESKKNGSETVWDSEIDAPVPLPVKKEDKNRRRERKKTRKRDAKKVKYHVEGLKDSSAEVRRTSAEMLGYIGSPDAVPALIEALNDRHISVRLAAHAALVRITGKNFGYKQGALWRRWWRESRKEFEKKFYDRPTDREQLRARAANTIGLELLRQRSWRAAQRKFLDAVDADPETPDYRNNLGRALMGEGRYLDAMEYFEETIGLNPELPQPYYNIGQCYQLLRRDIEAQHWYRKAITKDRKGVLWEHLHLLGRNLLGRKDFELAKEYLEQAAMRAERQRIRDLRRATLHKDLALAYYGLQRLRDAWRELQYIRSIGFEPSAGFVKKVRQELILAGADPKKLQLGESSTVPAVAAPDNRSSDVYLGPPQR